MTYQHCQLAQRLVGQALVQHTQAQFGALLPESVNNPKNKRIKPNKGDLVDWSDHSFGNFFTKRDTLTMLILGVSPTTRWIARQRQAHSFSIVCACAFLFLECLWNEGVRSRDSPKVFFRKGCNTMWCRGSFVLSIAAIILMVPAATAQTRELRQALEEQVAPLYATATCDFQGEQSLQLVCNGERSFFSPFAPI
jgi:hypothetical protein